MGVTNQLVSYYRAPFELYTARRVLLPLDRAPISAAAALIERRLGRHIR